MTVGMAKKYINLHAEIDERGTLNLVDDEGRILAGVKKKSIHTAHDELSYASVEIILKSDGNIGFTRGKVK
jgi:NADH dehydrogenase FAD-containing subunit